MLHEILFQLPTGLPRSSVFVFLDIEQRVVGPSCFFCFASFCKFCILLFLGHETSYKHREIEASNECSPPSLGRPYACLRSPF